MTNNVYTVRIESESSIHNINVLAKNASIAMEYVIKDRMFKDNGYYTISARLSDKPDILDATNFDAALDIELNNVSENNLQVIGNGKKFQLYYNRFGRKIKIGSPFDQFHEIELFKNTFKGQKAQDLIVPIAVSTIANQYGTD